MFLWTVWDGDKLSSPRSSLVTDWSTRRLDDSRTSQLPKCLEKLPAS